MSRDIFRDYIGMKQTLSDFPNTLINRNTQEFHFILGFASEDRSTIGNGDFRETWNDVHFGPEKVKHLKENFPNVKVIISIGGSPFHPAVEEDQWIKAAVDSLRRIILKYNDENGGNLIDGIDINYYDIDHSTNFSSYIGKVISTLKNYADLSINLVSIAPSQNNTSHYQNFLSENKDNIDFVNYQFYNNSDSISSADNFVRLFKKAAADFSPAKVLPGFSTDPQGRNNLPMEIFFEGCKKLKKSQPQLFHGAFIWNAHDSAKSQPPFFAEHETQRLLIITE